MNIFEYKIDENKVNELSDKYELNKDIVVFLLSKSYSETEIKLLTSSTNSELLPDDNITNVEQSATLISKYLQDNNSCVYIFADYDGDGINAGYIMYDSLKRIKEGLNLNCHIDLYLPQRAEGYGLNMDWCKEVIKKSKGKNALVITVDNGISKINEVKYLKDNKIEVLITDHHVPQKHLIPKDVLIVNPHLHDKNSKNALSLCGTAVAYKICSYLLNNIYNNSNVISNMYIPNVAIATITDMMSVTEENIIFVKNGISLLNNKYCNKALKHYIEYVNKKITPKDIAFELGPQLNACGRMGEIDKAIELFVSEDKVDIINIYNDIVLLNDKRKEKTKKIIELCKERIKDDDEVIIFRVKGIGGVGGNVANQLLDIYSKPVLLFHEDEKQILTGSARSNSISLQHLFKLGQQEGLIESFGGHDGAAGISVKTSNMNQLKAFFNKIMKKFNKENSDASTELTEETIYVNKIISPDELSFKTVKKYDQITFFNDLKEPLFGLKEVDISKINTSKNNPNNLCFFFMNKGEKESNGVWCWKFGDTYKRLGEPKKVNLIFSLSAFNGMLVMDIKHMEEC